MSRSITISGVNAVVGEVERQQVMDIVRGGAFVGALLLAWISLHPFEDLGNMQPLAGGFDYRFLDVEYPICLCGVG